MRSILLGIFELRRYRRGPLGRAAVVAMVLLPLLYGCVYLVAFWNPYNNLSALPVAVVNQDQPVTASGKQVDVGNQLTTTLVNGKQFDWTVTDAATASSGARASFMSAASPGVISLFFRDDHYGNQEKYLYAIAEAMRHEYETVANAGIILQIDCPDLGMGRHIQYADLSIAEFRKKAQLHIEALNHALANIPADRLRLHLCWGNYEGPHHYDVALADIIDVVLRAKPAGLSLEAANPRHAHEFTVFESVKLPAGKVLIPGVLESKTNFIEHPELVAQRIARYANLVGRENVIAGTDCGYGTWVGQAAVDPDIVWAKFAAMAEGARIASRQFWK